MKHLIYILLLCLVAATGCKTTKRSVQSTEVRTDSTKTEQRNNVKERELIDRNRVEKDSAIGIPKRTLKDSIKKEDLEIPRTKSGKAIPRHFETEKDGLKITLDVDTNGNLTLGCEADSLTLIVKSLIRDSMTTHKRYDSLSYLYQQEVSRERKEHIEKTVKQPSWWAYNWDWLLLSVIIVIILIIRFIKRV